MKFNQTVALVTLVAGGLLAGATLSAQETPNTKLPALKAVGTNAAPQGGMRPAMNPEKMAKEIGLNEEQTTKLKDAMQERRQKLTEVRTDTSIAQEDKRAKSKEIVDATNAKIKAFMSAEQYEKYLKLTPGPRNRPGAAAPKAAMPDKPATTTEK